MKKFTLIVSMLVVLMTSVFAKEESHQVVKINGPYVILQYAHLKDGEYTLLREMEFHVSYISRFYYELST